MVAKAKCFLKKKNSSLRLPSPRKYICMSNMAKKIICVNFVGLKEPFSIAGNLMLNDSAACALYSTATYV